MCALQQSMACQAGAATAAAVGLVKVKNKSLAINDSAESGKE